MADVGGADGHLVVGIVDGGAVEIATVRREKRAMANKMERLGEAMMTGIYPM